jgi:hypothetical protein
MAKASFKGYFAKYEYGGVTYYIKRGTSGYSRYYVLDENKKYLSKGAATLQGAQSDMVAIHNSRA